MTLDQLRIFLTVAHHLHFTRAAEELGLTQPAVSAAIHCLETEYSIKLFHRIGRQIKITEAGTLLRIEAQKVLDHIRLIERGLRELNNLQQGELRLGASHTVGNYWLPSRISQFKRQYPNITVKSTLGSTATICEGISQGLFDLGFVTGKVPDFTKNVLQQEIVESERLQIVIGQNHPWFGRSQIMLPELLQTDWIVQEPDSSIQQVFEQTLYDWGIDLHELKILMVVSSNEMVKAALEDVGAAALPETIIKKELQLKTLHTVQVMPQRRAGKPLEIVQPILKVKHAQRFQTQTAIAFEKLIENKI
jgi:DNA-binding transcriptional LysR family regulator